ILGHKGRAVWDEDASLDHVLNWLADKVVATVGLWQGRAAIDARPAGGGKESDRLRNEQGRRGERKDTIAVLWWRNRRNDIRGCGRSRHRSNCPIPKKGR